ncbi:MAG: peptidoglycan recognition family protein [Bacteroidota bacterium]
MKKTLFYIVGLFFFTTVACQHNFEVTELKYPENISIIKRSEWGWIPLEKDKLQSEITKITVHHGGVEFTKDKDPVASIQNLQKWSRESKNWIDLPYHFVIDLDGNIYEGRPINYPGDTNTEYDPAGHALVEVMGNYEIQELNKKQKQSLVELLAYLKAEFKVSQEDIKAHKDYSTQTVCPGKNIYKYFEDGSLLKEVDFAGK